MRRTKFWVAVAVLAFAGVACGGDTEETGTAPTDTATATSSPTESASAAESATVTAEGTEVTWDPAQVTIKAGGKVTWTWDGSLPHNVAATDKSWTSGAAKNKDEYSKTFDSAGEFKFICEVHGTGMSGTVTVV